MMCAETGKVRAVRVAGCGPASMYETGRPRGRRGAAIDLPRKDLVGTTRVQCSPAFRMNRFTLFVVAVLAMTGCSGADEPVATPTTDDDAETAETVETRPPPGGELLPVVIDSDPHVFDLDDPLLTDQVDEALPPRPLASSLEDVLVEMRRETIIMAGVFAETSGTCEQSELEPGSETTCTITYDGVSVPWRVSVSSEPELAGGSQYPVRIDPLSLVLRADHVYDLAWGMSSEDSREELRCDEIPDVHVAPRPSLEAVPADQLSAGYDTGFDCQELLPTGEPDVFWWNNLSVYHDLEDYSVHLYGD
jgi:hypothetical protein